jgi:GTP-binding protein
MNVIGTHSLVQKIHRTRPISTKQIHCKFVASYFAPEQIPNDPRPQIAFAGRSNVGKSSLLNKLVGQKKKMAKVSSTPGKTRSLNFFIINDRFYFVDLPGYGYAKVSKSEKEGWGKLIEDYLTKSKELLGLVLLLDCRRDVTDEDIMLTEWLIKRELPVIVALTKTDKLTRSKLNEKLKKTEREFGVEVVPFSTVSGVGKNELLNAIMYLVENKN